jgi:probable HAF family extracellular repeat protein
MRATQGQLRGKIMKSVRTFLRYCCQQFGVAVIVLATLQSPAHAQQYSIIQIPPAPTQTAPPLGYAINAIGEVTGEFDPVNMSIQPYAPLKPRLFVYAYGNGSTTGSDANGYANGATTDLGPGNVSCSSWSSAIGYGINSSAQIVGALCATTEEPTAFLYQNSAFDGIGETSQYASTAAAINTSGLITGYIQFPSSDLPANCTGNDYHTFLYDPNVQDPNASLQDLGSNFPCSSHGVAINDSGQIVGYFNDVQGNSHAYIFSNATVSDLGYINFPGSPAY